MGMAVSYKPELGTKVDSSLCRFGDSLSGPQCAPFESLLSQGASLKLTATATHAAPLNNVPQPLYKPEQRV